MKLIHLLVLILAVASLLTLLGCTESDVPSLPYGTSQFINQSTDLNYSLFKLGVYDNMVLVVDGNKLSVADAEDLNINVDLNGYVTLIYANATYEAKVDLNNDINSFGSTIFYPLNSNPANYITLSSLTPYALANDVNSWGNERYYPLNSNPAGYLTSAGVDTNCAVTNSCPNVVYWQDANTVFVKQTDGNVWYVLKEDFNILGDGRYYLNTNPAGYITGASLSGYLLGIDANNLFAFKSDVNTWGDARYYLRSDFNYLTFLTVEIDPVWESEKDGYVLWVDGNSTYYKRTDFNYLTFLTEFTETDPVWVSEKGDYTLQTDGNNWYYKKTDFNYLTFLTEFTELDPNFSAWDYNYLKLKYKPNACAIGYALSDFDGTCVELSSVIGYLTQADANAWYYKKTDFNYLTFLTEYTETDPVWNVDKTNYTLQTDGNVWYYLRTDFNYLTFLTAEADPYFINWDYNYLKLKYKPADCAIGYALSSLNGTCVELADLTGYLTQTAGDLRYAMLDSSNMPFYTLDEDENHIISLDTANREGRDSTNTTTINWDYKTLYGFWTVSGDLQVNGNEICDSTTTCYSFEDLLYDTNWQTSFTVFDANMSATYVSHNQLDSNLALYVKWADGNLIYYKKTDIAFPLVDANINDLNYSKLFGFPSACPTGYALQAFDGTCVALSSLTGYLTEVDGNNWYVKKSDFNTYANALLVNYYTIADANNVFVKVADFNSLLAPQTCGTGYALQSLGATPICIELPAVTGYVPYTGANQDLNLGEYNLDTNQIYANVIWTDRNRGYGTMMCVDGNIVMGYLVGYSC